MVACSFNNEKDNNETIILQLAQVEGGLRTLEIVMAYVEDPSKTPCIVNTPFTVSTVIILAKSLTVAVMPPTKA